MAQKKQWYSHLVVGLLGILLGYVGSSNNEYLRQENEEIKKEKTSLEKDNQALRDKITEVMAESNKLKNNQEESLLEKRRRAEAYDVLRRSMEKEKSEIQKKVSPKNNNQIPKDLFEELADSIWIHHYRGGKFEFGFARDGSIKLHKNWSNVTWRATGPREVTYFVNGQAKMTFDFNNDVTAFTNIDWDGKTPTTGTRTNRHLN